MFIPCLKQLAHVLDDPSRSHHHTGLTTAAIELHRAQTSVMLMLQSSLKRTKSSHSKFTCKASLFSPTLRGLLFRLWRIAHGLPVSLTHIFSNSHAFTCQPEPWPECESLAWACINSTSFHVQENASRRPSAAFPALDLDCHPKPVQHLPRRRDPPVSRFSHVFTYYTS